MIGAAPAFPPRLPSRRGRFPAALAFLPARLPASSLPLADFHDQTIRSLYA
jgi:hypothetical protein